MDADAPRTETAVESLPIVARLDAPRSPTPTRLAVVADPHVATEATGTSKLFERTESHLRAALADAATRDVDAVVSVGDLTKDGEAWNYEAVDAAVADLVPDDVPFLSVPGNHDVPKDGDEHEQTPLSAFVDAYAPGELPFHAEVGGVDLVGLNTAGADDWLTDTHAGAITDDQLAFLDDALDAAETPLVLMHHNLPAVSEQVREHRDRVAPEMGIPPEFENPEPLIETLDGRAPLVLTGHLHMPGAGRHGDVRELMLPTTCSFPQAYVLVDVGPDGTTVRYVPVADRAGLTEGFAGRAGDTLTSRELTAMASVRVASFPLFDER